MANHSDTPTAPGYWVDARPAERFSTRRSLLRKPLRTVGALLFGTENGPPPPDQLEWLVDRALGLRKAIGGRGMFVFVLALLAVTWVAPLWSLIPLPLTLLPTSWQARIVARWERSPFGLSVFAVKAVLTILWCEHPEAAREMGFDGQPLVPPLFPPADDG